MTRLSGSLKLRCADGSGPPNSRLNFERPPGGRSPPATRSSSGLRPLVRSAAACPVSSGAFAARRTESARRGTLWSRASKRAPHWLALGRLGGGIYFNRDSKPLRGELPARIHDQPYCYTEPMNSPAAAKPVAIGQYLSNPDYEHFEYIDGSPVELNVGSGPHSII